MKPNDVSDRAWQFACKHQPNDLLPMFRVALARSFDKATADLREDYERCQSEAMYEWDRISDRDSYDETSATLDEYTPGESK